MDRGSMRSRTVVTILLSLGGFAPDVCGAKPFLQANGQDKKVFRGNNAPIKSVPAAGQESSSSIENCSASGTSGWKGDGRQHG